MIGLNGQNKKYLAGSFRFGSSKGQKLDLKQVESDGAKILFSGGTG